MHHRGLVCWLCQNGLGDYSRCYRCPTQTPLTCWCRQPPAAASAVAKGLCLCLPGSHLIWRRMEVSTAWPPWPVAEWFEGVQQAGLFASRGDNSAVWCIFWSLVDQARLRVIWDQSLPSIFSLPLLLPRLACSLLRESLPSVDRGHPDPFLKAALQGSLP